jgi:phosphohistidine swiveling domain-containing protein
VQARSELLGALPARLRPLAHLVLRLTETFFPLREIGRASMLMSIDAGRAAARAFGGQLAAAGQLSRADDVFFLTGDELNGALEATQGHLAARVATRRSRREYYESISLPDTWTGTPTPQTSSISETYPDAIIRGIGVNGQSVEGQVRVVLDPDEGEDLAPGEILVCPMTDPSWVSLFYLAKAVVVDMGGPMSHGAIVARELGIPCIVNTRDGTRRLHTGDVVTVDPDAGTITIRQPRDA